MLRYIENKLKNCKLIKFKDFSFLNKKENSFALKMKEQVDQNLVLVTSM